MSGPFDGLPRPARGARLLAAALAAPGHAYLLAGPPGSGKRRHAERFAPRCSTPASAASSTAPPRPVRARGRGRLDPDRRRPAAAPRPAHATVRGRPPRLSGAGRPPAARRQRERAAQVARGAAALCACSCSSPTTPRRMLPTILSRVAPMPFRRLLEADLAADTGDPVAARAALGNPAPAEQLATDPESRRAPQRLPAARPRSPDRPRVRPGRRRRRHHRGGRGRAAAGARRPSRMRARQLEAIDEPRQRKALEKRIDERASARPPGRDRGAARRPGHGRAGGTATCWPRGLGAEDLVVHSDRPVTRGGRESSPPQMRRGRSRSRPRPAGHSIRTCSRLWPSRPCSIACGRRRYGIESRMATVVGVVFQPGGKVYSFDPAGLELRWNEHVICQTARGRELGRVVSQPRDARRGADRPAQAGGPPGGAEDDEQVRTNRVEAKRAMLLFRELIRRHELALKPLRRSCRLRRQPDHVRLRGASSGPTRRRCRPTSRSG